MKLKKTKLEATNQLKKKAKDLYRAGYTTREVGKIIGKSHAWVALAVKD